MIKNELDEYELRSILRPIIRKQPLAEVLGPLCFAFQCPTPTQYPYHHVGPVALFFQGFLIRIHALNQFEGEGVHINFSFERPVANGIKGGFERSLSPAEACKALIDALKNICEKEIESFRLELLHGYSQHDRGSNESYEPADCLYLADSFWEESGKEWAKPNKKPGAEVDVRLLSPLLIVAREQDRLWVVNFLYNPVAFRTGKRMISLDPKFDPSTQNDGMVSGDFGSDFSTRLYLSERLNPIDLGRGGRFYAGMRLTGLFVFCAVLGVLTAGLLGLILILVFELLLFLYHSVTHLHF